MKNLLKNKGFLIVLISLIVGNSIIYFTKIYWEPYYNYYFTKYDYEYPVSGKDFVVGLEPHGDSAPSFVVNILMAAFPHNHIVFSNDRKPHLIVRSEHITTDQALSKEYQKWNAPYITTTGERWAIGKRRYRRNGPPIAELVSINPKYARQLYFPYMAWCGIVPKRIVTNNNRPKFLAYIASNCIKEREQMFAIIKSKNAAAEALGICSNPQHKRLTGSWENLTEIYAQYNFALVMENHQLPGYITEKILNAFRGGAIPIYWGDSETVAKYFNPKAFIDIKKFTSFEQAADYIIMLSKDPQKMAKMRQEPIFRDNVVPEMFKINEAQTQQILAAANFIKKEYFKFIANGIKPI